MAVRQFTTPDETQPPVGERLRKRTRSAFVLIGILLMGMLSLATVAQIGGAVIASGEVAVASSVKTITHPTGGILTSMAVREGDHVAQGQILMRFDTGVSRIGSESASTGLEQLLARRARLESEQLGASALHFPAQLTQSDAPDIQQIMRRETELFRLRRAQRDGASDLLTERVRQYDEQIRGLQAQIIAIEEQLELIEPELAGLRRLYERQLVTINRLNQMERTAVQFRGSKAALQSNIAEVRARISETREQIANLSIVQRSEAAGELATVSAQLNEQQVRLASASEAYQRSVIRAPQSGTVDRIAFTTVGSAVPANQPILELVPDRDDLVIEGRVRPQDIDRLHVDQDARITFSGLNRQTTPDVAGKVTFISPDIARDDRNGLPYYRIRVRLNPKSRGSAQAIRLRPGMPAEIFVQTGDRSVLSFLIKPLIDQIRYALRDE